MKHKKTSVALAISILLGGYATVRAATLNLTSLVITSGTFAQGLFTPTPNPITHFGGQNLVADYVHATWDTSVGSIAPQPGAIMAWDYNLGGVWVNTYTAASVPDSLTAGGPVPNGSIDTTTNTISVDLSALILNIKGSNLNAGANPAVGAISGGATGTFTLDWTSTVMGGPFNGQITTWSVAGTYAAVPVPGAVWLMGSGLAGLAGLARRRRKPNGRT